MDIGAHAESYSIDCGHGRIVRGRDLASEPDTWIHHQRNNRHNYHKLFIWCAFCLLPLLGNGQIMPLCSAQVLSIANGGTGSTTAAAAVTALGAAPAASGVPSGMVAFITSGSCPAGWTENDNLATYNVLVTTTAAGDVGTHASQSLTAAAQTFTGSSTTVPAETVNSLTAAAQTVNSLTAAAQGFTGDTTTVPAETVNSLTAAAQTVNSLTAAAQVVSWPANPPTNAATATSGNCAATNIAAGTGSTTACKATAPNLTVPAEVISYPANKPTAATSAVTGTMNTSAVTGTMNSTTITPLGHNATSAVTGTMNASSVTGTLNSTSITPLGGNASSAVSGNAAYYKVIACQKN